MNADFRRTKWAIFHSYVGSLEGLTHTMYFYTYKNINHKDTSIYVYIRLRYKKKYWGISDVKLDHTNGDEPLTDDPMENWGSGAIDVIRLRQNSW